jgi:FimV-like protein
MRRPLTDLMWLLLAFALPGSGYGLGLGDIHVESSLRRPLNAYIEIVGASAEDLATIKGSIPREELFKRYGLERPTFLSSASFTVELDKLKRPILVLKSADASMEPMVSFLVDLKSPAGEVIREYTVMFDPPELMPTREDAEWDIAASAPTAVVAPAAPIVLPTVISETGTHTVRRNETLQRIVARTGVHSKPERHRMMVAIYRKNPQAFVNNIHILRTGSLLHLADAAEIAAISEDDANRELASQLATWRALRHRSPRHAQVTTVATTVAPLRSNRHEQKLMEPTVAPTETQDEPLDPEATEPRRPPSVQRAQPSAAEMPASQTKTVEPDQTWEMPWMAVDGALMLALAAGAFWLRRRWVNGRKKVTASPDPIAIHYPGADTPHLEANEASSYSKRRIELGVGTAGARVPRSDFGQANVPNGSIPIAAHAKHERNTAMNSTNRNGDTTVELTIQDSAYENTAEFNFPKFNTEATINTTHVTMPGSLHDEAPFVERRKSPADILRQALEREPMRSDLRLKLLELYYVAAEQNRRAFLEIAHHLAKNINLTSPQEWSQILDMGRKIAADDSLFSQASDDQAVA